MFLFLRFTAGAVVTQNNLNVVIFLFISSSFELEEVAKG
jgi:hypothetical protein